LVVVGDSLGRAHFVHVATATILFSAPIMPRAGQAAGRAFVAVCFVPEDAYVG
jgi:hypothetical protein